MTTRSVGTELRSGPGQSGATAGQTYFDERMPGANAYPTDSLPQGSRSTFDPWFDIARPTPKDAELQALIARALGTAVVGLDIAVAGGAVTLAGPIVGDELRRELVDAIGRLPGVVAVVDHLEVAPWA